MFQMRKSVFETNSSSCHSIMFSKEKNFNYDVLGNDKVVYATGGEFGWGFNQFKTFYPKFQYLITHIFQFIGTKEHLEEEKYSNKQFKMLKEVIKEYLNTEIVFKEHFDMDYPFGYIDRNSWGTASKVFKSKGLLIEYLFNTHFILTIFNDNTCEHDCSCGHNWWDDSKIDCPYKKTT